jgi:Bacteriophage tail sheath protein
MPKKTMAGIEYQYPGVYIEELPYGVRPISGVDTSTTGFVGRVGNGDGDGVARVKSFEEFERAFGDRASGCELGAAVWLFFANGGTEAWVVAVRRRMPLSDGLRKLDAADALPLLCLPGEVDAEVLRAALEYAERRRALLLVDPSGAEVERTIALARTLARTGSANAGVYFPPVRIVDRPAAMRACPPGGAVAGVYARHSRAVGVWCAPEGSDAVLSGAVTPAVDLSDDEASKLAAAGVNCIRKHPAGGVLIVGADTVQAGPSGGSEWTYVPVRRLALFIEESLDRGMRWAVFEPNDEPLWTKLRLQSARFLDTLFSRGALKGASPAEAYLIRCGPDTMTQNDIDNGRLNVVIGIAPTKPAEFVEIRIGQWLPRAATESYGAQGAPSERLCLRHRPVAAEGVFLQVADGGRWETWTELERLDQAGPASRVYTLDRERAELRFGDGEHGAVVPAGDDNVRITYRYGTGRRCSATSSLP